MTGRQGTLRGPTSALLLTRFGVERGVPAVTCLRGTGLQLADLERPDQQLTAEQELTVIGNLVDALDDPPGLGLDVGRRYHLTSFGMLGFAALSSPTMRLAIKLGMRYADLSFTFCRLKTRDDGDLFHLLLDVSALPVRLQRFLIERDLAMIQVFQREAFGPAFRFCRMMLGFPAPPDGVRRRYEETFGLRPEFDAPGHVVAWDGTLLDRPLPQAEAHTAAMAEEQCRRLVEERRPRTGPAGQVRLVLLARPEAPPSLAEAAGMLNLSPRTLRRRLAEEGVSYRALLDEVRAQLAEEMLLDGRLTVEEVAQRLGYAETSSFTSAFRRWTGRGPQAHREAAGDARAAAPDDPGITSPEQAAELQPATHHQPSR